MCQPRNSLELRTNSRSPVTGSKAACDSNRGLAIRGGAQRVTVPAATEDLAAPGASEAARLSIVAGLLPAAGALAAAVHASAATTETANPLTRQLAAITLFARPRCWLTVGPGPRATVCPAPAPAPHAGTGSRDPRSWSGSDRHRRRPDS